MGTLVNPIHNMTAMPPNTSYPAAIRFPEVHHSFIFSFFFSFELILILLILLLIRVDSRDHRNTVSASKPLPFFVSFFLLSLDQFLVIQAVSKSKARIFVNPFLCWIIILVSMLVAVFQLELVRILILFSVVNIMKKNSICHVFSGIM